MNTENHLQNKLQIKAQLKLSTNMEFLMYKNYILSVSHKRNTVDFYDMKTFRKKFYLKRKRHEKNFYHEKWKLIITKEHKVFLLGYEEEQEYFGAKYDKELDIYLLKIGQRKCAKKASFSYYMFIEDEKDDKLYIITEYSIIQYDFISGTSNEMIYLIIGHHAFNWVKFCLVNNYFVIFYVQEVAKGIFQLVCKIIDKNLENTQYYLDISNHYNYCDYYYDFDSFYHSRDSLVQISDNFFPLYSEEKEQTTKIDFAELQIDEKIFNEENNNFEDNDYLVDLILFNKEELNIKETGKMNIYPINNEKFGIVFNHKNFYICNISKVEIILHVDLKIDKKLSLLNFKDDNAKYQLYLNDKNNLFYLS